MSDNEQRERIIAKIKKCLALSASPEPAEAAAAMRQAQKLMEKYNIDMATVERPEIFEARVHSKMSVSTPKRWEVALVAGICRAFGCRFYFMPGNSYGLSEDRSEEHTSELQSLMRISYAVFCLKKKKTRTNDCTTTTTRT